MKFLYGVIIGLGIWYFIFGRSWRTTTGQCTDAGISSVQLLTVNQDDKVVSVQTIPVSAVDGVYTCPDGELCHVKVDSAGQLQITKLTDNAQKLLQDLH